MGLFGGVNQAEHDALKRDFSMMRFTADLEKMKYGCAMLFSDLKFQVGKSCGVIDSVSALVENGMTETAKILYQAIEPQLVENINRANQLHRDILNAVDGLGSAKQAYINHLSNDEKPLYVQVNEINDLNIQCINMLKSFDQMFDVTRG
ncbi:hypothetical protein KXY27_004556 [Salmonella enterica]|nr:hypothetical protein [Salmonella enterica]EHU5767754.1 hypothetical protein [Salmonella enterica]